ncbi:hypothetical protein CTAYLR_006649 [Chrysophaeum taylorii]|uniref:Uncharacterized protein n=1 Tax=Chrysophaeum taylorii TaxID=2483200 RepID=A0AAD7XQ58_9STRA|nr:hypothetical protein CTAYLR_006649 [Chrysophaeum taylorii]
MADSAELMEHMSIFADQHNVKTLLKEYMRRVVVERPQDPITFLITQIRSNPYVPEETEVDVDSRSPEEKRRCVDYRPVQIKLELLRQIFNQFAERSGQLNRGKFLVWLFPSYACVEIVRTKVALRAKPALLLEAFPRHAKDIPRHVS